MLDVRTQTDPALAAPLSRVVQLQCRALAAIPHEFRAVSTWLNYNCAMLPQLVDPEERARLTEDLGFARAALDQVMVFFDPHADLPDYDPQAVSWFRSCLARGPQGGAPFLRTAELLRGVQSTVENMPEGALAAHRTTSAYIISALAPEISALMSLLEAELSQQEEQRLAWARQQRRDAEDAIAQIRTISQMVRLISLNASVEAARAGEAGRAFGIIAQEVKALSESIQSSASDVTATVETPTDRL